MTAGLHKSPFCVNTGIPFTFATALYVASSIVTSALPVPVIVKFEFTFSGDGGDNVIELIFPSSVFLV